MHMRSKVQYCTALGTKSQDAHGMAWQQHACPASIMRISSINQQYLRVISRARICKLRLADGPARRPPSSHLNKARC